MASNEFCTMTTLAQEFEEANSHTLGQTLKDIELRRPDGKPTSLAHSLGLVEPHEGPQPWLTVWWWHREKTMPFLERAGMTRKEVAANG